MGCSFDRLGVTIIRQKDIQTFVDIFNKELKDDLYWGEDDFISEDIFEEIANGIFTMSVEQEPLFRMMENGLQFENMLLEYLKVVPDVRFYAWYECTFNNCGDIVHIEYIYMDGTLKIERRYSEQSALDYCPECEWEAYEDEDLEDETLCLIEDYDPEKEYKCPNCGVILEWDMDIINETMTLINGEWISDNENTDN